MAKSRKPFSLQLKRPSFCKFWGLKAFWRKNYDYKQQFFFLEILKAVCLSVDWVPKLTKNFFSTLEQNLVQRCETEIVGDAYNASYIKAKILYKLEKYKQYIKHQYKIKVNIVFKKTGIRVNTSLNKLLSQNSSKYKYITYRQLNK